MSFILEALKKSDSKRQDGMVPKLETVHNSEAHARGKRPRWHWSLLSVLILNAAVLLWLFGPWQQQPSIPPDTESTVMKITPMVVESSVEEISLGSTDTPTATSALEPAPTSSLPQLPNVSVELTQPTEKIRQQPVLVKPVDKSLRNTDLVSEQKKILLVKDLPVSIRRDLPEMHMSVHAFYSDKPMSSLVRINDQIMRTGALLSDKYVLEEITSDGAVFLYAGYRFLVPRKNLRNR